jgi:hypothetical protein
MVKTQTYKSCLCMFLRLLRIRPPTLPFSIEMLLGSLVQLILDLSFASMSLMLAVAIFSFIAWILSSIAFLKNAKSA